MLVIKAPIISWQVNEEFVSRFGQEDKLRKSRVHAMV
jgi:hypothetical protein